MSGSSSLQSHTLNTTYRWQSSRWINGLLTLASAGLLLLVCGFYIAPEVSAIQTTFYLTLLPAVLLLMLWRRDFRFVLSWQFAVFCGLPLALALSSLWAQAASADIQRDVSYYLKLVAYLALFYCALYLVMERRGGALLEQWLRWLIPVGTLSCLASLIHYGLNGGFDDLQRIGGVSLEGDIDKTGLLYGFLALFCCYGLTLEKYWRWVSWSGLLLSGIYILLSQTKIPIVMAGAAVLLAAFVSGSRAVKAAVLLGAFAVIPIAYLLLFGDLPLLHRSNAYSIRLELWGKTFEEFARAPLIGSGLMYKQYLEIDQVLPHPHNYLLDIARFSGLLGVAACLAQLAAAGLSVLQRDKWTRLVPLLYSAWFAFGVLAMLIYAQQPLVKPSYIWFFYWIPLAVLLVQSQLPAENDQRGGHAAPSEQQSTAESLE